MRTTRTVRPSRRLHHSRMLHRRMANLVLYHPAPRPSLPYTSAYRRDTMQHRYEVRHRDECNVRMRRKERRVGADIGTKSASSAPGWRRCCIRIRHASVFERRPLPFYNDPPLTFASTRPCGRASEDTREDEDAACDRNTIFTHPIMLATTQVIQLNS